ncbi:unnamed protein product, partial [Polarella glacialis]
NNKNNKNKNNKNNNNTNNKKKKKNKKNKNMMAQASRVQRGGMDALLAVGASRLEKAAQAAQREAEKATDTRAQGEAEAALDTEAAREAEAVGAGGSASGRRGNRSRNRHCSGIIRSSPSTDSSDGESSRSRSRSGRITISDGGVASCAMRRWSPTRPASPTRPKRQKRDTITTTTTTTTTITTATTTAARTRTTQHNHIQDEQQKQQEHSPQEQESTAADPARSLEAERLALKQLCSGNNDNSNNNNYNNNNNNNKYGQNSGGNFSSAQEQDSCRHPAQTPNANFQQQQQQQEQQEQQEQREQQQQEPKADSQSSPSSQLPKPAPKGASSPPRETRGPRAAAPELRPELLHFLGKAWPPAEASSPSQLPEERGAKASSPGRTQATRDREAVPELLAADLELRAPELQLFLVKYGRLPWLRSRRHKERMLAAFVDTVGDKVVEGQLDNELFKLLGQLCPAWNLREYVLEVKELQAKSVQSLLEEEEGAADTGYISAKDAGIAAARLVADQAR